MRRQELHVSACACWAEVRGVDSGQKTLKDAINEAMGLGHEREDHSLFVGQCFGAHPYPTMVRIFIG